MYLTEFGIQRRPDPFVGVGETRQAEYRSIAERIAWRNPRVRAFSQYLMRDDLPRAGRAYLRYGGFESGIRHSHGKPKRAYRGFRLPLTARQRGRRGVSLWGLVRPARARTRVTIEYRSRRSRTWRRLKTDATNGRSYWSMTTRRRAGRRYRVRWGRHLGAPTRVYPRRSFARMLIALPATPPLTRVANRTHLRQLRIGHCTGCGTTVRADDVLGLIGFHVAHAECSLVRARRLRSGRH